MHTSRSVVLNLNNKVCTKVSIESTVSITISSQVLLNNIIINIQNHAYYYLNLASHCFFKKNNAKNNNNKEGGPRTLPLLFNKNETDVNITREKEEMAESVHWINSDCNTKYYY